jgi:DNA repair exonuclease SbcCD ATPase subunit
MALIETTSIREHLIGSSSAAAVFVALIFGLSGCASNNATPAEIEQQAFDDLRTELREVIGDPSRAAAAVAVVDELEADLADLRQRIETRKQRVRALNADYYTPRAEFEAYLNQVAQEIRQNRNQVSDTYERFLAAVNADERAAIRRAQTQAMNAAIQSIQSI